MAVQERSEVGSKRATSIQRTSDRELVITRTFNGPPHIVFDAWTRADFVRRWFAPKSLGVTMASCEADVRVGGTYRYVLDTTANGRCAFSGEYQEITPPSRLVYTTFFEPQGLGRVPELPAAVVTVTFEERDGKTYLTSRELYPSKEV
ncbi:MAG TPA: SRPBCC domain-containing protein, partial [Gemmatimonadaceae bacterium]